MKTRENTVVIVLTKHAWLTINNGEIISEDKIEDGSPLMSYQSVYPNYNVVQLTQATLKSKALKLVDDYFKSQPEPKKVSQPEEQVTVKQETMSQTRRERRKAKQLANKQKAKETIIEVKATTVVEEPVKETVVDENVTPEIIAPGKDETMKVTYNKSKSNTMKNVANSKVVVGTRVRTAKLLNLGVDIGYFALQATADLWNFAGSTAVHAIGEYEQSVQEIMQNRRDMVDHYEKKIIESPKFVKEYTKESFAKLQRDRDEKLDNMQTA